MLGPLPQFKETFVAPIVTGTLRNATELDSVRGAEAATRLRELIAPVFLRREKSSSLDGAARDDPTGTAAASESGAVEQTSAEAALREERRLPEKIELVCWVYLRPTQVRIRTQCYQ